MTRIYKDFYLGFIGVNPSNPRHPCSNAFLNTDNTDDADLQGFLFWLYRCKSVKSASSVFECFLNTDDTDLQGILFTIVGIDFSTEFGLFAEVHQKADFYLCCLEIIDQLRFMFFT